MNILTKETILLNQDKCTKNEAIKLAGQLLVDNGIVKDEYIDAMYKRDEQVSVYMGNLLAIPHGVDGSQDLILKTGISFIQFDSEVDFDGNPVRLVVGIAALNGEHMDILSNLAILCSDMDNVEKLLMMNDKEEIIKMIEEEN